MDRVEQALARIEAAAARIEAASARARPSGDLERKHAALRNAVDSTLQDLDALIGALER